MTYLNCLLFLLFLITQLPFFGPTYYYRFLKAPKIPNSLEKPLEWPLLNVFSADSSNILVSILTILSGRQMVMEFPPLHCAGVYSTALKCSKVHKYYSTTMHYMHCIYIWTILWGFIEVHSRHSWNRKFCAVKTLVLKFSARKSAKILLKITLYV